MDQQQKIATKIPKYNNAFFFQKVMAVALKREETKKDLKKITNILPIINQCEWKS